MIPFVAIHEIRRRCARSGDLLTWLAAVAVVIFVGCLLTGRAAAQQADSEVRRLIESLAESNPGKRVESLRRLTDHGSKAIAAVSTVLPLLEDPEPEVRREAVWTLAAIGPQAAGALPQVTRMLIERDVAIFYGQAGPVRKTVAALAGFGQEAVPLLAAVALQGVKGMNQKAIDGYERTKAAMLVEDNMDDCEIRREACTGLGKLADPRGLPVLLKVLTAAERMRPARDPLGQAVGTGAPGRWGQQHTITVQAILAALGDLGIDDARVMSALKKHARRFPIPTDTALRKIRAAQPKNEPIERKSEDTRTN